MSPFKFGRALNRNVIALSAADRSGITRTKRSAQQCYEEP
jgi:hypothetical protein